MGKCKKAIILSRLESFKTIDKLISFLRLKGNETHSAKKFAGLDYFLSNI